MLNPETSPAVVKAITPALLAAGMGNTTFTPPLKPDDPTVKAMAAQFAYEQGVQVIPATIQYLNERKEFEGKFLQTLAQSAIPATLIWGIHDTISPLRVADYVWNAALKNRKAPASYWLVPCGNHYLQHDQAAAVAAILRAKPTQPAPFNAAPDACSPVLVAAQP